MRGDEPTPPRWILPAIVTGQVLATSMWFAPNAVIGELRQLWGMDAGEGLVTTAVTLGFIAGTMVYAMLGLADRFHPGNVFLVSAVAGAVANLSVLALPASFAGVMAARFAVGVCLAGVYPVGMRIAAAWYHGGLGRALGFLVGALVLGTASSHLLRGVGHGWDWRLVVAGTSLAALSGGLLVWRVPEGPFLVRGGAVRFGGVLEAFRRRRFRASVGGYFGHCWELYAFWAFVPVWLGAYGVQGPAVSYLSFAVIAIGAVGCAGGGFLVRRFGGPRVALAQLLVSGLCCAVSPLAFDLPPGALVAFLLLWGLTVIGDSPQFSAMNAQYAPRDVVGSALTLANCIGFSVSILSLVLLERLRFVLPAPWLLTPLVIGPVLGLWAARRLPGERPDLEGREALARARDR